MIVPIKKAKIVVLKEDKDSLLKSLQKHSVLMLISLEENDNSDINEEESYIQRTERTLKLMSLYREKKGLFDYNVVDYDSFIDVDPKRKELLEELEGLDVEINRLVAENHATEEAISHLTPWLDLDFKISNMTSPRYARIHTGYIDYKIVDKLTKLIEEYGSELKILGRSHDSQAVVFANYIDDDEVVFEGVKSLGFTEVDLPNEEKSVRELIEEKKSLIELNQEKIKDLTEKLKGFSSEVKELELFNDQMVMMSDLKRAPHITTHETIYIEGWVRSDRTNRLKKAIEEATDSYDLEITDPLPDEAVPTATKNNNFVSSFESVTNMFSKPNPGEIDPNPVMAPWYWIIFGMMMADVGYGIVMAVLFFGAIKLLKPKGNSLKLFRVLLYSSITTIIFGILFGSYFGVSRNPILFDIMTQPMQMLILTLIVGALHVITGILTRAYINIKNKKYLDAIADQISWVMIIVGLGFLALPKLSTIGIGLSIAGALLILLFAGRAKKNIFGKIAGGLGGLYGVTGYMSDILSYSRILALSLSTAVVAMVMNLLAGMVRPIPIVGILAAIVIYLVGHVFNIAIGLLSAYVHDSRLQYIEFFNKFYEGGGYEFKPLSINLKYIDEVNKNLEI